MEKNEFLGNVTISKILIDPFFQLWVDEGGYIALLWMR